jgi:hypothetical protein
MGQGDPGSLPAPTRELIDEALERLYDPWPVPPSSSGTTLQNAPVVIVYRDARQWYDDPLGIWTVDQHHLGHLEVTHYSEWRVGLVADAGGVVLGEFGWRTGQVVVVKGDREIARAHWRTDHRVVVQLAGAPNLDWLGSGWHSGWSVYAGTVLLAVGRTSYPKLLGKKGPELAMPIWLHPELDLERRSVALLVLLGLLGPPLAPLDAD